MSKYRRSETVALLLAAMLHRSGKTRGRISEKTLKLVARRTNLRGAFETEVSDWLNSYNVWLLPLDRGGWALVAKSALEGAPPLTAVNYIKPEFVHIMFDGRIVESGGGELADKTFRKITAKPIIDSLQRRVILE